MKEFEQKKKHIKLHAHNISDNFPSVHASHALQTPPIINLVLYCLLKYSDFLS